MNGKCNCDRAVFQQFKSLIEERIRENMYMSEDTVRYLFMCSVLTQTKLKPNSITVEKPYFAGRQAENIRNENDLFRKILDKKLDMFIETATENTVIEFKFFRQPSSRTSDRTGNAARLILDMERVLAFQNITNTLPCRRLVILLTDNEMKGYFKRVSNGFSHLYNLQQGEKYTFIPRTLNGSVHYRQIIDEIEMISNCQNRRNRISPDSNITATSIYSENLPEHDLKIYLISQR